MFTLSRKANMYRTKRIGKRCRSIFQRSLTSSAVLTVISWELVGLLGTFSSSATMPTSLGLTSSWEEVGGDDIVMVVWKECENGSKRNLLVCTKERLEYRAWIHIILHTMLRIVIINQTGSNRFHLHRRAQVTSPRSGKYCFHASPTFLTSRVRRLANVVQTGREGASHEVIWWLLDNG